MGAVQIWLASVAPRANVLRRGPRLPVGAGVGR
jgi:hypothetical protein